MLLRLYIKSMVASIIPARLCELTHLATGHRGRADLQIPVFMELNEYTTKKTHNEQSGPPSARKLVNRGRHTSVILRCSQLHPRRRNLGNESGNQGQLWRTVKIVTIKGPWTEGRNQTSMSEVSISNVRIFVKNASCWIWLTQNFTVYSSASIDCFPHHIGCHLVRIPS